MDLTPRQEGKVPSHGGDSGTPEGTVPEQQLLPSSNNGCDVATLAPPTLHQSAEPSDEELWAQHARLLEITCRIGAGPDRGCQLSEIQDLIRQGVNVNVSDEYQTPLIWASRRSRVDVVLALLAAGADTERVDWKGQTPLTRATTEGHLEIVRTLLQAGAAVNPRKPDKEGHTPLIKAAMYGHTDIAKLLLEWGAHTEVTDTTKVGQRALHRAARHNHFAVVDLLLEHGAHVDAPDSGGGTALLWASRFGHLEAVRELLKRKPELNARDLVWTLIDGEPSVAQGNTALGWAAWNGHPDVVRALLEAGADSEVPGWGGCTPLILAAGQNSAALAGARLRQIGKQANYRPTRDSPNPTAVRWSAWVPHNQDAARRDLLEAVRLLLEAGANTEAVDQDGFTALAWAKYNGHTAMAQELENAMVARVLHQQAVSTRTARPRAAGASSVRSEPAAAPASVTPAPPGSYAAVAARAGGPAPSNNSGGGSGGGNTAATSGGSSSSNSSSGPGSASPAKATSYAAITSAPVPSAPAVPSASPTAAGNGAAAPAAGPSLAPSQAAASNSAPASKASPAASASGAAAVATGPAAVSSAAAAAAAAPAPGKPSFAALLRTGGGGDAGSGLRVKAKVAAKPGRDAAAAPGSAKAAAPAAAALAAAPAAAVPGSPAAKGSHPVPVPPTPNAPPQPLKRPATDADFTPSYAQAASAAAAAASSGGRRALASSPGPNSGGGGGGSSPSLGTSPAQGRGADLFQRGPQTPERQAPPPVSQARPLGDDWTKPLAVSGATLEAQSASGSSPAQGRTGSGSKQQTTASANQQQNGGAPVNRAPEQQRRASAAASAAQARSADTGHQGQGGAQRQGVGGPQPSGPEATQPRALAGAWAERQQQQQQQQPESGADHAPSGALPEAAQQRSSSAQVQGSSVQERPEPLTDGAQAAQTSPQGSQAGPSTQGPPQPQQPQQGLAAASQPPARSVLSAQAAAFRPATRPAPAAANGAQPAAAAAAAAAGSPVQQRAKQEVGLGAAAPAAPAAAHGVAAAAHASPRPHSTPPIAVPQRIPTAAAAWAAPAWCEELLSDSPSPPLQPSLMAAVPSALAGTQGAASAAPSAAAAAAPPPPPPPPGEWSTSEGPPAVLGTSPTVSHSAPGPRRSWACPLCAVHTSSWALLTCRHRGPCEQCCPTKEAVVWTYPACYKCHVPTSVGMLFYMRVS